MTSARPSARSAVASICFGTNPRGIFDAYEPQTIFVNPGNCELRATLLGDKQVLKEAQDLMIQRLGAISIVTL